MAKINHILIQAATQIEKHIKIRKKNEQELRKKTYKLIYCLYFSSGKFSKPSVCSDVRPCACKLLLHKKSV